MQESEQGDAGQQAETREVLERTYEALQTATIEVSGAGAGMQATLVNTLGDYTRPAPTRDQVEIAIKTIHPFADAEYVVKSMREYFGELFTSADEQRVREIIAENAVGTMRVSTQPAEPETAAAPAPEVCGVTRLERARALPELAQGEPVDVVPDSGIQSFKDIDRRTMNVVLRGNQLFKQQAPERATKEV